MATAGQSEAVWQTKYDKNMKLAYGLATEEANMRILAYCQKNQSSDHKSYIFYKTGRITAQDGESNYDATNKNYTDLKGIDITDFGKAVMVNPTESDCPFYRKKYADILSQVSVEGNLITTSVSALIFKTLGKLLAPLKAYTIDDDFSQKDELGNATTLTIPAGQKYGDITKNFYENEDALFEMLSNMEFASSGSGAEVKIGLIYGTKGNKAIKKYDRTSNLDYITTKNIETKMGKKLAIKKFDIAEMLPINGFDSVFNDGKGHMIAIFDKAMGYDVNQSKDVVAKQLDEKKAKFFNTTIFDGATIVDQEGIYIFSWNGVVGDRVVKTEEISIP